MSTNALARSSRLQLTRTLRSAMCAAIAAWADATMDASSRRRKDLLRDKVPVRADFFKYVGKGADQITPIDVKEWQAELERRSNPPLNERSRWGCVRSSMSHINDAKSLWALPEPLTIR